jgi:hypothetical protein
MLDFIFLKFRVNYSMVNNSKVNNGSKKRLFSSKMGRIMSLFWSFLLIFFVAMESILALLILNSSYASSGESFTESSFTGFFGPVLPPILETNEVIIKKLSLYDGTNVQKYELEQLFSDKIDQLSPNYIFKKLDVDFFEVSDINQKIPIPYNNEKLSKDKVEYVEVFYYLRPDTTILEIRLELEYSVLTD